LSFTHLSLALLFAMVLGGRIEPFDWLFSGTIWYGDETTLGFSFEFAEEVANRRLLAVFLGVGSRADVDGGRLDGRRRTACGSR
jgi:hypothetical protein